MNYNHFEHDIKGRTRTKTNKYSHLDEAQLVSIDNVNNHARRSEVQIPVRKSGVEKKPENKLPYNLIISCTEQHEQ